STSASPWLPPFQTGPTVWITWRTGGSRLKAGVAFASPGSHGARAAPASASRGPAAQWIAPSTPPPSRNDELAALTIASTCSVVMSPLTTSMTAMPPWSQAMTVRDLADTQLKDLHVKCVARDASSTQKRLTAGFVHKEERIVKNAVSRRLGAGLAALAATTFTLAGLGSATPAQAQPQENCLNVEYAITPWSETEHSGGFVASITLTNVCDDPVPDWTLALTLAPGHSLSSGWSADWTATGDNVIATAQSWNQVIAPGSSIIIGFVGVWTGSYQDPSGCVINAAPCDGTTPPVNEEPPTVTLTYPTSTLSYVDGCPLLFTAEASDPDGIDRVEFYVNGVLVGTADTAPYRLEVSRAALPSRAPPFYQYTAFARAYDAGTPPASSDSEPTTFS